MRTSRINVWVLAVVALLCTGALLRWVQVSRATEALTFTPLAIPLSELPERIGDYQLTKEVPLTANVIVIGAAKFSPSVAVKQPDQCQEPIDAA